MNGSKLLHWPILGPSFKKQDSFSHFHSYNFGVTYDSDMYFSPPFSWATTWVVFAAVEPGWMNLIPFHLHTDGHCLQIASIVFINEKHALCPNILSTAALVQSFEWSQNAQNKAALLACGILMPFIRWAPAFQPFRRATWLCDIRKRVGSCVVLIITTWPRLNCKHWPFKQFLAVQTMLHVTFRFLISKFVQIFVVYLLSAVYLKPIYYWDALHVLSVVTFRQNCWTLKMAPAQRWIHPLYGDHCRCLYISHFRNLRNALVGGEASAVNCGIHCHKHKEFKVLPIYHMLHHDWHSNDWKWLILFFKIG